MKKIIFFAVSLMLFFSLSAVNIRQESEKIIITAKEYRAFITPANGHLQRLDFGGKKTVFYPSALWRASLKSGNVDCNNSPCTGIRINGNKIELDYTDLESGNTDKTLEFPEYVCYEMGAF